MLNWRMMTYTPPIWYKPDGTPLACVEKIKVLNDNIRELQQFAQDALDDAILMGGTAAQLKTALHELVDALVANYPEQT
ncbi:MAG: hypothetical protein ACRCV6_10005 [Formosimonas sp.]